MPFEIRYEHLPAGFIADVPSPDKVLVRARGFTSSEDGDDFIRQLDGLSNMVLSRLPGGAGAYESKLDHLVAVIRPDKTATVYVNELMVLVKGRFKDGVPQVGAPVYHDQFADVYSLELRGATVPPDAGVMIVLSSRWRKGFYYDLEPLPPLRGQPRAYDLQRFLGQLWTYLSFQNRVNINDAQWAELLKQEWFPFIGLSTELVRQMCFIAKQGKSIDELIGRVEKEVRALIPNLRIRIQSNSYFAQHQSVIARALDHFESGDFLSCTALVYPRIEGILRSYHATVGAGQRATQSALAGAAVVDPQNERHDLSLLMPDRFRHFLERVYFASFDPANVTTVSRNSVAHGVAPESAMTLKAALLGILLAEQLSFLMNGS